MNQTFKLNTLLMNNDNCVLFKYQINNTGLAAVQYNNNMVCTYVEMSSV